MTKQEILHKIYPSVVTFLGNWKEMMADAEKLKIKDISLFLTGAGVRERKLIYAALGKTSIKNIPHVHARGDMKEEELDFFVKKYYTQAFTIHYQFIDQFKSSKSKKVIFCENNYHPRLPEDLKALEKIGGLTIDLSHLEQYRRHSPGLYYLYNQATSARIGCNHVSAVTQDGWSRHRLRNKSELDYLAFLPKKFFSRFLNIELANSIPEQLQLKKYMADLLFKAWNKN